MLRVTQDILQLIVPERAYENSIVNNMTLSDLLKITNSYKVNLYTNNTSNQAYAEKCITTYGS